MRLSADKARRLTQLVWRERARRWLPLVGVVLLLLGASALFMEKQIGRADPAVSVAQHDAIVMAAGHSAAPRGASTIHVQLDDGRDVNALSGLRVALPPGSHVVVDEVHHASGQATYHIVRSTD